MSDLRGVDSTTAVSPSTPSDAAPPEHDRTEPGADRVSGPVRTCIGCRRRAAAAELLRVVVSGREVVPDPRHRAPGRGAWLHPDPVCLDLAERRRAFGRALRDQGAYGPLDPAPVREHVVPPGTPTSGNPQE